MRFAPLACILVVLSLSSCGRPEYVVPHSGEAACACNIVCACGMSQNEDSQKERTRCFDACSCDTCPGEPPPGSEKK